jgi:PAS domain S-box-containing protein
LGVLAVVIWAAPRWARSRDRRAEARPSGTAANSNPGTPAPDAAHALIGLEKAVETMQLGVTITDLSGKIVYTNPADARMHGYEPVQLIGQDVSAFAAGVRRPLSPEDLERMRSWRRETSNTRRDGTTFPVYLMSDVVRDRDGQPIGVVTTCEDISQRKAAGERRAVRARGPGRERRSMGLERPHRRRALLGPLGGHCGMRAGRRRADARRLDVAGSSGGSGARPDRAGPARGGAVAALRERASAATSGRRLSLGVGPGARGANPSRRGHAACRLAHDITARKTVEEQLLHDAFHDPLTGLPNRAFFVSLLDRSMKRTRRRPDYLFAVLFVDFDRFKLVNDSFGHTFGDLLLVAISQRLKACLRPGDVVARMGGDEFTILLDDIRDVADATREVFTTASIGIALSTARHEKPEFHLRDADLAMYRAKARGRACYEMFDQGMHERAVAQLQMETDLRRALEREELRVYYQPIVDLRDGVITGFEALVRWQHPERGMVSPGAFIPLAEETGLIVPIGRWVMERACRQTATWQRRFTDRPLSISVNLSARHFGDADLVAQILEVLRLTELPPTSLKLEITESVLMEDPESHVSVIAELRKAGVQVQIDDFGTGYSSLSYLQRFSIDALKIDRSFISAATDGESWDIVQTIVTLARDLGVNVIAEGVETVEQTDRLKALACDHAQGYLFREPVDAEAAEAMLLQQWQRKSGMMPRWVG